jgi:hypothetical protein
MLKPDTDNVVPEQTRAQLVKVKGSFCASFKCARDAQSGASQSKYTICCIQMRRQAAPIIISLLVRPADPTDSLCFLLAAAFSLSAAATWCGVCSQKHTHTHIGDWLDPTPWKWTSALFVDENTFANRKSCYTFAEHGGDWRAWQVIWLETRATRW